MSDSQVYRRKVTVKAEQGLHIRPCTAVAQLAMKFQSRVRLMKDTNSPVDAKSILDLMSLAAGPQSELELEVDGPDAAEAMEHLSALFESDFMTPSPAVVP
ncbi:MAG: HPr family phosphocarrier protein [Planctomycetaceae bacterium]|nr:HPr family phosphocarrier protein [Planctomycetaceae bacterium]